MGRCFFSIFQEFTKSEGGVLVTNAYVCYCKLCDEKNNPKKQRRSHLEFQKDLAIAWIDPDYFYRYLNNDNNK